MDAPHHAPVENAPVKAFRLLRTEAASGAWNMAVDKALMESVRHEGMPTLRFYRWSPPTLSFGRNQPTPHPFPRDRVRQLGLDVVRRETGGRAVLHDVELTYAVVCPSRWLGRPRQAYVEIQRVIHTGLSELGYPVTIQGDRGAHAPVPSTDPCFATPLPGEILLDGRKVVGSAQFHQQGVLLQHGSILLDRSPRMDALEETIGVPVEGDAAYLGDHGAAPDPDGLALRLERAIATAWESGIAPLVERKLTPEEAASAARYAADFEEERWTWRR